MATFFNTGEPNDVALVLPSEFQKAAELDSVVDTIEYELIDRFTRRLDADVGADRYPDAYSSDVTSTLFVLLRGYNPLLSMADTGLAEALRRTIGHCVGWRLQYLRREPHIHSQHTTEGKFARYTSDSKSSFPPDWDKYLRHYDLREPPAYI